MRIYEHEDASDLREDIDGLQAQLNGESQRDTGVCSFLGITHEARRKAFRAWPEFSGDITYPVPCPPCLKEVLQELATSTCTIHEAAYDSASGAKWSTAGTYGQARRRLAQYMIDGMREELALRGVSE